MVDIYDTIEFQNQSLLRWNALKCKDLVWEDEEDTFVFFCNDLNNIHEEIELIKEKDRLWQEYVREHKIQQMGFWSGSYANHSILMLSPAERQELTTHTGLKNLLAFDGYVDYRKDRNSADANAYVNDWSLTRDGYYLIKDALNLIPKKWSEGSKWCNKVLLPLGFGESLGLWILQ